MDRISHRVAISYRIATDEALSVALSDLFRGKIQELSNGQYEFGWDTRGGSPSNAFGYKPGTFSFPVRPNAFPENNLIGGCLVRGTYNPKDLQGDSSSDGKLIEAKVITGYYFKKTDGKLDRIQNCGTYYISFDDQGNPSFYDEETQDFKPLIKGLEDVVNDVLSDPPEGAQSQAQSKETRKKKEQERRQKERDEREIGQRKLLEEKARRQREQQDADSAADKEIYGSFESFADWAKDEQDGMFTNTDLIKLQNNMGEALGTDPKKSLTDLGLTFKKPGQRASSSPTEVAEHLRAIATKIEHSSNPSKSKVATALKGVLDKL